MESVKRLLHQGLFIPVGLIWTRLSPMNQLFLSARLSSSIASNRPLFWPGEKRKLIKNRRPLVIQGSGEGRMFTLHRHYARPSVESGRRYTKAPKGRRDKGTFRGPSDDQDDHGPTVFDRLLFFNMIKNNSQSLSVPNTRGTEAIAPDLSPNV